MDKEIVKSILPDDLYQEFTALENKQPAELDTCKIPNRNISISPLSGCVPIVPNFDSSKEVKKIANLVESILSGLMKSDEQNKSLYNDKKNNCFDIIDLAVKKISTSTIEKANKNQFVPLQQILKNLAEVVVYNTILEQISYKYSGQEKLYLKFDNSFTLELNDNGYYKHISKLPHYHLSNGIRNFDIHNAFDDLIKSVVVRKEYKLNQQVSQINIIKYYVDVFELSTTDIGDGNVDFNKIFYDKILLFKLYVVKFLNELYNKVLSNKTNIDNLAVMQMYSFGSKESEVGYYKNNIIMFYDGIDSIINSYINDDISNITNLKLYTQISIDSISYDYIVVYFEKLNLIFQKNISDYFLTIDILDFEQIKYETIYELLQIPCTSNIESVLSEEVTEEQTPFDATLKRISKNKDDYDFLNSKYWKSWTRGFNLISLIPTHWTVGIITPTGTKIKLPIIYTHLLTVSAGSTVFVVWLSINGLAISPVIMTIDNNMKSTWKTLFRGGNQLIESSQGSKPVPTGFEIPQSVDGATATIDTKPDLTSIAPMLEDSFPSKDRMSISNPAHLKFLNTVCNSAKNFMGLVP